MRLPVGAAAIEVTPPSGLPMAGFGARTRPATNAHDPLSARALVVGDTALVVVDAIGLDGASTTRIAGACGLDPERMVVAATHTHGGPHTMPGKLGGAVDAAYLARLEAAAVEAIVKARLGQRPCGLFWGVGRLAGIAHNRRDAAGPVDPAVPVLKAVDAAGRVVAMLVSFACHPVVLDATNLEWTADYPGHARRALEARYPGAVALFATGCAGDVNTGHSAHRSNSLVKDERRSHAEARRIGEAVAMAALDAPLRSVDGAGVDARFRRCTLGFAQSANGVLDRLLGQWRVEHATADPTRRAILNIWIAWAEGPAKQPPLPITASAGVLRWGELVLACLPGEIFAATGLQLRRALPEAVFALGYCGDNPGYLPPREEYAKGGYEVVEAHRFYGLPAAFAPGSAEAVRDVAIACGRAALGASA